MPNSLIIPPPPSPRPAGSPARAQHHQQHQSPPLPRRHSHSHSYSRSRSRSPSQPSQPQPSPPPPPPPPPPQPRSSLAVLFDTILYLWNFGFLPLRLRWRINKYKRMLLHPTSPLRLRSTLRHARALRCPPQPSPYTFIVGLLWPFPSWRFPAALPAAMPRDIMAAPASVSARSRDLMYLRSMPLWRARDTPQRALYRLYEAFCADDGPMIQYEVEYYWRRSEPRWATANLQDPMCEDPEQYTVLAGIVEELVESFMWRLELGMRRDDKPIRNTYKDPKPLVPETCPEWTARVRPLEKTLVLHLAEEKMLDGPFFTRNIWASSAYFYTV